MILYHIVYNVYDSVTYMYVYYVNDKGIPYSYTICT